MGALLHNAAAVQQKDDVAELGRGQPVGDKQHPFSPLKGVILPVEGAFRRGVEGGGRLV